LSYFSSHPLYHKIGTIYGFSRQSNTFVTYNFLTKKFGVRDKDIIRKYAY